MRVYQDLVVLLRMGMLLLMLLVLLMMWLMRPELVKRIEALSAAVLNILNMGPEDALFGMALGMALGMLSIVDIRIVAFVAGRIARHAWIPPQRTALAGRRGKRYYVLDHCWVALCFQKARGCCVACSFLGAVRLCAFQKLGIYAPI
jgi:hypothetical protein